MSEAERNCLCSPLIFVVFCLKQFDFFLIIFWLFVWGCLTASLFFNRF